MTVEDEVMREIKVRGYSWEELSGDTQWVYGYGVKELEFAEHYAKEKKRESDVFLISEYGDYQVHKGSVGEYTGLKDKNGADIYEGDILSTDLDRPYLIVEFRNGAFMFQCHDNGKDYYDFMATTGENSNFTKYHEVIGNIYEHNELLERSE